MLEHPKKSSLLQTDCTDYIPKDSGIGERLLSDLNDVDEDPCLSVAARVLEEEIN